MKVGLQAYVKGSREAVAFYQKAFGVTLGYNVLNDDGSYMHAELYLDGQLLIAISESGSDVGTECMKKFSSSDYPTMNFCINFENEAAVKRAYDVLTESGNILIPLGALPWSSCCANVIDKYGIFWYISV